MTTTGNATVTPLEHTDVRGKKLKYLKLEANGKELVINIGDATYKGVEDILTPREVKTVVNVMPPDKTIAKL